MTFYAHARRLPAAFYLPLAAPAIVYAAMFAAVGSWYPFQAVVLSSRGLDLGAIGLLLGLHGVVALVAAPVWGAIADRAARIDRPLLAASLVAGAGAFWLAVAQDAWSIAGGLALMGIGIGGMNPLADTRTVEVAGGSRSGFARARAFGSAAFVVAAIVTGTVISGRTPDALFALFVPLLVVTGLSAWRLFAPAPDERVAMTRTRRIKPSAAGFFTILRRPGLLALLVGTAVIWTAVGAVMTFIAIRVTSMGADLSVVGLISAFGSAIEVPIMLAFPILTRRFSAERQLLLGALAFALRSALWAVAPTPLVAILVAPLGGIGFALFYVGIVTVVAKSVPAEAQATAQGVYSGMTYSLGSVVGAVLGGAVAPFLGLPGMFAVAAVAGVIGALVVWRAASTAAAARRSQPAVAAAVPA